MQFTYSQFNQAQSKLPLYGRSDTSFGNGRSAFTGGISIKLLPLVSNNTKFEDIHPDAFQDSLKEMTSIFRKGIRTQGVIVNSTFEGNGKKKNPDYAVGSFDKFVVDNKNKTVRAFIRDIKTQRVFEVYPSSLQRLNESVVFESKQYVKSIDSFGV